MSPEGIRRFATEVEHVRDQAIADATCAVTEGRREYEVGKAAAARQILAYLHIYSGGEYGADTRDQPNPFEVPLVGVKP